jgi:transcriptional regulator with XRE-family HTH domain
MKKLLNLIGAQVRRLRNDKGWSQNDLATKLQLKGMESATRSKVSKIESGLATVRDEDAVYISNTLGIRLADLFHPTLLNPQSGYFEIEAIKASKNGLPPRSAGG